MPAPRPSTSVSRPKPRAPTAPNSGCAPRAPGSRRACRRCRSRARLAPAGLTQQQALEQNLLRIQSAVAQGRGDEAWREVSAMQAPRRPAAAARYYETRQQVAIATGHLLDGIRSEFSRERLIGPGDARARAELLAQLRAAAERGVSLAPPPGSDAWCAAGSKPRQWRSTTHAIRRSAPRASPRSAPAIRRIPRSRRFRVNLASASEGRVQTRCRAAHGAHAAAQRAHRRRRPRRFATDS